MHYTKKVLDNGLRVITVPMPDSLTTTVLVLVEAGSEYETKEMNGISHFLEHMVFKGTKRRPKPIDIAKEMDLVGAQFNAFTQYEMTGYYAKVANIHFDRALDVVSDIYVNSIFDEKEIDKERGIIIEEMNMYEDMPKRDVIYVFTRMLYGDQPAGWHILGTKENIRRITRDDFLEYHRKRYIAPNTVVVVAGATYEDKALKKIENHFREMPIGGRLSKSSVSEEQGDPRLFIKPKQSDQTHFVLGFRGYSLSDPRRYALKLLSKILGGGMSSRLFQRVREELGAAYYISSGLMLSTDHGHLGIAAGVNNEKLTTVIKAVMEECQRFLEEQLDDQTLEEAKDNIEGLMMTGYETSDDIAEFYGDQEVLNQPLVTIKERVAQIRAVTPEEVDEVAKDIFQNSKLNLALIGPHKDEEALKKLLKIG